MSIFGGCFLIVGIVIMFSDVIQKRKDISYSNYNNDDTNNY